MAKSPESILLGQQGGMESGQPHGRIEIGDRGISVQQSVSALIVRSWLIKGPTAIFPQDKRLLSAENFLDGRGFRP